ncbi:hypothetical protein NVP1121O_077 [Vibrio phage 1.121.O._10N.286.46.C4]|nr:hypothetical protein NVP1121O_077 [Vibrio phage 1.121.O._10N.286.46.C4]
MSKYFIKNDGGKLMELFLKKFPEAETTGTEADHSYLCYKEGDKYIGFVEEYCHSFKWGGERACSKVWLKENSYKELTLEDLTGQEDLFEGIDEDLIIERALEILKRNSGAIKCEVVYSKEDAE